MRRSSTVIYCIYASAFALLHSNCSTHKSGFAHRAYHNTTAHYNGYFNGRESFRAGVAQIRTGYTEDYTNILPVFVYGDENAAKSAYPQMDKAIEKCEKVIQRHSIYIKGEEYVDWIDDCWFLIGQCHFYKQEYDESKEKFEYVARQFQEKEIHFEASIWLARTYLQMHNYAKTGRVLDLIREDEGFPLKLKAEYSAVYADYYIRQHNYLLAIPEMRNAIANEKNRKKRVRYLFILAQLYRQEGNYTKASDYFAQVARMNPPYEMEFYAKINRALSYDVGSGNKEEIKKELGKMLRDGKNSDYYDQIYYALAEVYFREGEQDMGIELLKKSVASSRSNTNQKGLSFLKLADVHFNNEPPAYQLAQAYYDSAVTFIDKARPDFNDILNKRNSLSRLVRDLTTIQMEDSLQMLASMSEKELDDLIDGIIQQVIEEEEKMQEEQENNYLFANENSYNNQNAGSGANWYFYNPATIGFGFSEFKRIWGDRKLEDNWRRKDKNSVITQELDEFDEFENAEEDTLEGAKDNKNKNYYLKNIPLTEEKMMRSHNKIIEAYYDLGLVYKERLSDNYMAIESFKELVRRYDTCRYALSSYYQLYRLYLADDNQEEADYYKRLILTKAPGSEYAQLIKNPNYFLEKQKSKTNLLDFYKNTYSAFSDKQWTSTLNQCVASDSLYPQSRLAPKFHLLKALTLGKISGKDTLVMELKKVIALHPDREEAREAKRILNILNRKKPKNGKTPKPGKKAEYKLNPKAKHLFLLIFPNTLTKASELKKQISDFNKEYFRLQNFQVASMFLVNGKTQLITVREFPGKAKAVNYYKTFSANCKVMKSSNSDSFSLFIISTDNFSIFYRDKNVKTYDAFFKKNYLDNQ